MAENLYKKNRISIFVAEKLTPNILSNTDNMKNRLSRMEALRTILIGKDVGSQEEILRELERYGFKITQATLSRDLRRIKAVKTTTIAGFKYILPDNPQYRRPINMAALPMNGNAVGLLSIAFSNNIVVLRTRPGYAASLATEIDSFNLPEVLGTVAGDDTLFAVMSENMSHAEFIETLSKHLPEVANAVK